ncbi:hypothetical protein GCM10009751_10040 [Myceligenerans crystallogenes]|uniref:Immunity protein 53 n=2 Tax=Myceligenerans crystallogenes TaxID=316335 RepID=A0ABP4ZGS7_9MICO
MTLRQRDSSYIGLYWSADADGRHVQVTDATDPDGEYFLDELFGFDVAVRLYGPFPRTVPDDVSAALPAARMLLCEWTEESPRG